MGLAEKIPGIRRLVRNQKPAEAEEAPVATQYIIRDSRGNALDMGQFIGRAAQALEASTGDETLRTLRQLGEITRVTGMTPKEAARTGSILLYQATGGQVITEALREMAEEQQKSQAEALTRQEKALRYKGVRGKVRKTLDSLDPFIEPDGW